MLFNSIEFLIFFPVVIAVYYLIPGKLRQVWLLVASYYFYMSWNPKYLVLILFTTVVTYAAGRVIEKTQTAGGKKAALAIGITANLLVLFFFKYFDFFLENVNRVLGALHLGAASNPFDLLLPVGISFYTFQALGYVIDVYRGTVPAERNLLRYALFVSFFPQLVAGPIERSGNLLKQVDEVSERRLWTYDGVVSGFGMMLWGLFMKMVIADRISIFVDNIFANTYACGSIETIAAAFGFSIQIYADFAGYSAIAIGAARMMGFTLMENFNCPYFATSIAEFWRRWHISLSTWFRDYVYIPLGGNRKGKLRKYLNLMITFLVSGLWHGAAWSYVVWGLIHGTYQIIGDLTKSVREKVHGALHVRTEAFSFRFGQQAGTFLLAAFAWIFFRARSMGAAVDYLHRMFTRWNPWALFDESLFTWGLDRREVGILAAALLLLLLVSLIREYKKTDLGTFLLTQNLWFRWGVMIVLALAILVCGEYGVDFDSTQFIYFDF